MKMNRRPIQWLTSYMILFVWLVTLGVLTPWQSAEAGVPVTIYQSFAGNMDFTATGGTLRTQPNTGDSCAVTNSDSATLSGIPVGSTITAAYLYWAGSGSTPDYNVTLDGVAINADRTFTETFNYNGTDYDFFSGFEDVTSQVAAKGNGTYTFANLTVDNGAPHCGVSAVLSGWSLLVVYENATEPLRVINVFDGFQYFRGSSLTLTPDNFVIPNSGIDGRHGILTWEGDVENSAPLGGFTEALTFNGTALTDGLNPNNNQFNSTINLLGSNTSYGVDLDVYDITTLLNPGDTSATSIYSSGGDLVLLNMEVISVTNTPVADLAISKTHTGDFTVGQNGVYTLSVSNIGPSTEPGPITVTDTLPAGLTYVSATGTGWTCGAVGQDVTCTHAGPLNSGTSLADITLTVSVAAAAQPSVTNTATVSGTAFDNQLSNNSSSDVTNVPQPNLSTSTKTVVDLNGGDADPGDTLRYTITLIESGGAAAANISVTDNLPANTTNLSVVSYPAGATDNSTPVLLDISNISLPAGGTDTIVFDVTVSASASPLDTIDNTATINNPAGPGATPSAPTVIISASQVPASGNKPLYLYNNLNISRVIPTVAQPEVTINNSSGTTTVNWTLNPNLQSDLEIDTSSGAIPVNLWLRASGSFSWRNITITLSGSVSGTIGSWNGWQNIAAPAAYAFNIPITGATNLVAGEAITLTIANTTGFGTNQFLHVTPSDGGANHSYVNLPSNTVINVDNLQYYDAAYPAGTAITSTAPGSTVYIRTVVSDPFGSFDITSSTITLLNPGGSPVVSSALMAQVADSGAATKTYEFSYAIPAAGSDGAWTAQVTANEGTEGTVSHQRNASLQVVSTASLTILKSVQTISDPIHGTTNPFDIPGAQLLYTIQVTNNGTGSTDPDTVVINDTIPANTALQVTDLGLPGSGPVAFSNGSPVSGLSYTFLGLDNLTDDLQFSTDGTNWDYEPSADANGVDTNVRYIRINLKNAMLGNSGGGDPSFQIQFVVVIQ